MESSRRILPFASEKLILPSAGLMVTASFDEETIILPSAEIRSTLKSVNGSWGNTTRLALSGKASSGFWSLINDSIWTPHNIYAGIMVVIFIITYIEFLQCRARKQSFLYGIMLGALASSAFCTSIYAGLFAAVIFVVTILPFYLFDKSFRKCFNTNFVPQLLMLGVVFVLCGGFLFYLLRQGNGETPVVFGILPAYANKTGIGGVLGSILNLYFVVFYS